MEGRPRNPPMKDPHKHTVAALIASVALLVSVSALVACTPARTTQAATAPPASRQGQATVKPTLSDTIELVTAGIARPLESDATIPITADILGNVAIAHASSNARYARAFDLTLYHDGTGNRPVENATVQFTAQMRDMDHGSFMGVALQTTVGHYASPLNFPMPGAWQLAVVIRIPDMQTHVLTVALDLQSE